MADPQTATDDELLLKKMPAASVPDSSAQNRPGKGTLKAASVPAAVISPDLDALEELSNLYLEASPEVDDQPVLLCNDCGTPLLRDGSCATCNSVPIKQSPKGKRKVVPQKPASSEKRVQTQPTAANAPPNIPPSLSRSNASGRKKPQPDPNESEFWDLVDGD